MAAGTVLSGGFPGRVAQEVQPNPKCNGCLHFDGQGGRTGICTIGLRPWGCGDGDAADIGYAPIARGAGTYLSGMTAHVARAPEGGDQEVSDLYGAGSTRAVTFQQVSLGEEHIHFVKSMVERHTTLQKSMCRHCQSSNMIGMGPSNVGPQFCSCQSITAFDVAKSLMQKLSNRERSVIDIDDLVAFVYDVSKAGFKSSAMEKATFYHEHGKYEVSPAGGGQHHVDFHPRGGGESHRVGTFGSPREARGAAQRHHTRFASGTGADNAGGGKPKSTHTPPGLPSMKEAVSVAKKGCGDDHKESVDDSVESIRDAADEIEDEHDVKKSGDGPRHPHDIKPGDLVTHSSASGFGRHTEPGSLGHDPHGQLAQVHSVRKNPHTGETHVQVKYHQSNGKMSKPHLLSGYDSSRHATHEDMQHHSKTLKTHFNAKAKRLNAPGGAEKSFDNTILLAVVQDDMEKSLRWSHKAPGEAKTSHGKYSVTANEGGGHTVTYHHKESGKSYSKTFHSHREALGAVTEHHIKNRPPPKPRKKKDPNAPKTPKAAGAGGCPPCP